jgi:hypothetical protein
MSTHIMNMSQTVWIINPSLPRLNRKSIIVKRKYMFNTLEYGGQCSVHHFRRQIDTQNTNTEFYIP